MRSLLNPAASRFAHPLSKLFADVLPAFPDLARLPERVAVLYVMFLVMRWQVQPSRENYDRLPDWVRPLPSQRAIAHPAWLDHLPFRTCATASCTTTPGSSGDGDDRTSAGESGPGCQRGGGALPVPIALDDFFIPYTATLSLNWGYEDTDALVRCPAAAPPAPRPDGSGRNIAAPDDLLINPVFERHLRRLENWTLGDNFALAFPRLNGTYNLRSGPGRGDAADEAVVRGDGGASGAYRARCWPESVGRRGPHSRHGAFQVSGDEDVGVLPRHRTWNTNQTEQAASEKGRAAFSGWTTRADTDLDLNLTHAHLEDKG